VYGAVPSVATAESAIACPESRVGEPGEMDAIRAWLTTNLAEADVAVAGASEPSVTVAQ